MRNLINVQASSSLRLPLACLYMPDYQQNTPPHALFAASVGHPASIRSLRCRDTLRFDKPFLYSKPVRRCVCCASAPARACVAVARPKAQMRLPDGRRLSEPDQDIFS
jgi:hypothetical protein